MNWPNDLPLPSAYQIRPVDDLREGDQPLDAMFCHEEQVVYIYTPVIKIYLDRMLTDLAGISEPTDRRPHAVLDCRETGS